MRNFLRTAAVAGFLLGASTDALSEGGPDSGSHGQDTIKSPDVSARLAAADTQPLDQPDAFAARANGILLKVVAGCRRLMTNPYNGSNTSDAGNGKRNVTYIGEKGDMCKGELRTDSRYGIDGKRIPTDWKFVDAATGTTSEAIFTVTPTVFSLRLDEADRASDCKRTQRRSGGSPSISYAFVSESGKGISTQLGLQCVGTQKEDDSPICFYYGWDNDKPIIQHNGPSATSDLCVKFPLTANRAPVHKELRKDPVELKIIGSVLTAVRDSLVRDLAQGSVSTGLVPPSSAQSRMPKFNCPTRPPGVLKEPPRH